MIVARIKLELLCQALCTVSGIVKGSIKVNISLLLFSSKYLCCLPTHIVKHWTLCLKQRKDWITLYTTDKENTYFFPIGKTHILTIGYWNAVFEEGDQNRGRNG